LTTAEATPTVAPVQLPVAAVLPCAEAFFPLIRTSKKISTMGKKKRQGPTEIRSMAPALNGIQLFVFLLFSSYF